MNFLKHILNILSVAALIMWSASIHAQTPGSTAVYYACAESGFKLSVANGFEHYQWTEDSTGMPGMDTNTIVVQPMGVGVVGDTFRVKTYHVKVMNNASCWSEPATLIVYILPKMELTVSGYTPPYCEHLSHDIPLTARINGNTGSSALTLPPGVDVQYTWTVEPASVPSSFWNAEIIGATDQDHAQVVTPQTTTIDNVYTVQARYTYPASVNVSTDVVGNCNSSFTQVVHADPAPPIPSINYESI